MHADSSSPSRRFSRAFTLLELLIALACIGVVLAILLPMNMRQRQTASLNESISNLQQIGSLSEQYAADNQDRLFTFTWRAGENATPFLDLRNASDDLQAISNQAVGIMRRRGNRSVVQAPALATWIPSVLYSHLVLADYAAIDIPSQLFISPEDDRRNCWATLSDYDAGRCPQQPLPPGPPNHRWPFSSSYERGIAFFSNDRGATILPGSTHNTFFVTGSSSATAQRFQGQIAFPAQKAHMWDTFQRHFGERRPFFSMPEARVPVLTADASVRVRSGDETNRGWNPSQPDDPNSVSSFQYAPQAWEPALPPGTSDIVFGRQRFTANGLLGRDFDGDEIR